ncbi:response regulator [Treponema sp.]|uniref:response regulator n=1 Tax=Treponema sp. TaxID=166 RepID=UPI003F003386
MRSWIIGTEKLDCILLDVMMPELNGFQLVKRIRAKDKTVPVIMLTARVSQADKVLGLDIGADDYVTKPFDPLKNAGWKDEQFVDDNSIMVVLSKLRSKLGEKSKSFGGISIKNIRGLGKH